uniref:Trafficking protein particle complex subunit n=1 Tax=Panagrolaimus sp. ES5 TaxID=591445 RepID=A0AC34G9L8_9BILA
MTLYNLYIFNSKGECICYKEWRRENKREITQEGEFKLIYGLILSLRSFAQRISTKDGQQYIKFFNTSGYKMNYMETATGLKFVLNTDPDAIVKNPLITTESTIESQLFHSRLDSIVKSHHSFV